MFVTDFINAIKAYAKAIKLIQQLNLWKYFFVPAIIGLVVGGIIISIAYSISDDIGNRIASYWTFEFGKDAVETASQWVGFFLILFIGISIYKHIIMALSAPFMSPVSEKIEEHYTGKKINLSDTIPEFLGLLVRGLKINLRNLFWELLYSIPLIILGFIPLFNLFSTALLFYIQSYYAGFGNMDYTMERHLNYKESIDFVRKNKGIAVGNGLIFTLMLFIPVVGIIITLPISTVASTTETLKKLEVQRSMY